MESRTAQIELWYEGKNITEYIQKDLINFSYSENASGSSDDISITLKDINGKWISDWCPNKGDYIEAKIITNNWRYDGDYQELECGTFMVDDVGYTGRPRTLTIGAVSHPANTGFMETPKNRTFKEATVKKIAESVIKETGISLFFDSKTNPTLKFIEQSEQEDVSFLYDLCQKNGLAMKLYNKKLIIFNEQEYETKNPGITFMESNFIRWDAKNTFAGSGYDGCKIAYTDPKAGTTHKYTFKAPKRTGVKIYAINEKADSLGEAQRLAKSKLRELNKSEFTLSSSILGNLEIFAGQTFKLDDLGVFKGKYFIDKITHTLPGFETSIESYKVLEGY